LSSTKHLNAKEEGTISQLTTHKSYIKFTMTFGSNESDLISEDRRVCLSHLMFNEFKRKEITAEWLIFSRQEMRNSKY
jgi:hypothetical protein